MHQPARKGKQQQLRLDELTANNEQFDSCIQKAPGLRFKFRCFRITHLPLA